MVCRESPASNGLQLQRELPLQEKNRTGIKSLVVGGGGVGGVGGGGGVKHDKKAGLPPSKK